MLVLDVETFKYDLLTGLYYPKENRFEFYWNNDALLPLTKLHSNQLPVINYNGDHYDLPVLYNWYFNKRNEASFYQLSKLIVEEHFELKYPKGHWNSIDLLFNLQTWVGLKVIEAIMGWEIIETSIPFDYDYKLTESQRREVEHYNKQDLRATAALYEKMKYHFECRRGMCKFLGIEHDYSIPLPTLVGMGLGAHRVPNKQKFPIHDLCKQIPIKHPVKDVMLKQMENPDPDFSHDFVMGGFEYTIANGGIHSKYKQWSGYDVYHVDVKGYYSLIMMNFNLFSRNLPPEGIKKYHEMYHTRLAYKKTNPLVADSMKIGLLAIWGATRNYHHILYDNYVGTLITLYGQLFLMYLIEMCAEENIMIINANTDGLIVKGDLFTIKKIVQKWETYGGWDTAIDPYKRFIQKDVSSYVLGNTLENVKVKGRDFTAVKPDWLFSNIIVIPQVPVVSKLLLELLFNDAEYLEGPEGYVRSKIKNYDVADYMFIIHHTMKFDGMRYVETGEKLQRVNRVYAHAKGYSIEKYKFDNGYKYPGLPPCKICNNDLSTVKKEDLDIDYEWYTQEVMRKYVTYYG